MRTLTLTAPDPDDRDPSAPPAPVLDREPPPATWQWVLDQRGTRTPEPRPAETASLALAAHTRPLVLEPVHLPRVVPAIRIDAAPRRRPAALADHDDEAGQATAEYALVLLGAAAIALLVVSWATKTNIVGKLLDVIFSQLVGKATGR